MPAHSNSSGCAAVSSSCSRIGIGSLTAKSGMCTVLVASSSCTSRVDVSEGSRAVPDAYPCACKHQLLVFVDAIAMSIRSTVRRQTLYRPYSFGSCSKRTHTTASDHACNASKHQACTVPRQRVGLHSEECPVLNACEQVTGTMVIYGLLHLSFVTAGGMLGCWALGSVTTHRMVAQGSTS